MDSNLPPPQHRVSIQDVCGCAPFLMALCSPGGALNAQGVRTVIALAQTGVLGKPEDAAAVLRELWYSFCPPGALPCVSENNTLKELRKAAKEAGVNTGGKKEDILTRIPRNVPPSFLKMMQSVLAQDREHRSLELIDRLNDERNLADYSSDDGDIFISGREALGRPYTLPNEMLERLNHTMQRNIGRRCYFKKHVAEVALVYHGAGMKEEHKDAVIAQRDAAANRLQALDEKKRGEEQRHAELNALCEQNGIQTCPFNASYFLAANRHVSKYYIWPEERPAELKEVSLERAFEAASEAHFYAEQIPDVASAAREKYKMSDYNDPLVYLQRAADEGRGKDALAVILTKGVEESKKLKDPPDEVVKTLIRCRKLRELGVQFPQKPVQALIDGQYSISALYAADAPQRVSFVSSRVPALEETKRTVEDALWYVREAGGKYYESQHLLDSNLDASEDTSVAHVAAAQVYIARHGRKKVLSMDPKPPKLVAQVAERACDGASMADVGRLTELCAVHAAEMTGKVLSAQDQAQRVKEMLQGWKNSVELNFKDDSATA